MHAPRKVALAIAWNLGFVLVTAGCQIVITMVLGRLLTPSDYGVFAFANALVVFGMHLTQRGLASAILRQQSLTAADIGHVYIAALACALSIVGLILAGWAALRWGAPALEDQADILLFMAVPIVIQIMTTPAATMLLRDLDMKRSNINQTAGIVLGNGGAAIWCAAHGFGPWSLAIGQTVAALVTGLLNLQAGWTRPELRWQPQRLGLILRDAAAMNGLRALDVAWLQIPLVIFGFRAPEALTGIYQRMQFISDILLQMTVGRISAVLYSALASRGEALLKERTGYRFILLTLTTLVVPMVAFVWCAAEPMVGVLLGPDWLAGAWALRLLFVAFGVLTINQAANMALEFGARYRQRFQAAIFATFTVLLAASLVPVSDQTLLALPAMLSMLATMVVVHVGIGERLRDVPSLLLVARPGALLAIATVVGTLGADTIATGLALPRDHAALVLGWMFAGGLVACALVSPIVLRLPELRPAITLVHTIAPKVHALLRPLHGQRL